MDAALPAYYKAQRPQLFCTYHYGGPRGRRRLRSVGGPCRVFGTHRDPAMPALSCQAAAAQRSARAALRGGLQGSARHRCLPLMIARSITRMRIRHGPFCLIWHLE